MIQRIDPLSSSKKASEKSGDLTNDSIAGSGCGGRDKGPPENHDAISEVLVSVVIGHSLQGPTTMPGLAPPA
jgi:hypothetical protein